MTGNTNTEASMAKSDKKLPSNNIEVILFIARSNVKTILRDEFKKFGITNFLIGDTAAQTSSHLAQHKNAPIIIDWENGQQDVVKILSQISRSGEITFRPVMLICINLSEVIVGTAAEYDVQRIHSGELTRQKISLHVESLLNDRLLPPGLKQGLQMAASSRQMGDWKQSLTTLRTLHDQYPENQRLTAELVENLIHLNNWADAAPIAKQLSDIEPGYPRALGLFGRVLMKQGRYPEAIEVFKRANILNPMNVDRLVNLAKSFLKIDKVTEARTQFDAALKLDDTSREASLGLGECALLDGDVNEALDFMRDVSSPRETASLFNSAAILSMRQGRYEIGKKLYQVAMRSVEEDAFLLSRLVYNLGIGYFRWQRDFDALECFEKAARLDPKYDDARANVAILAKKLKTSSKLVAAIPNEKNANSNNTATSQGDFTEKEFDEEVVSKSPARK